MKKDITAAICGGYKVLVHKKVCAGRRNGVPVFEKGVLLATYGEGYPDPEFSGESVKIGRSLYEKENVYVTAMISGLI